MNDELKEYHLLAMARANIDDRMRELQQTIFAGFSNGETRQFRIGDTLIEVNKLIKMIRISAIEDIKETPSEINVLA